MMTSQQTSYNSEDGKANIWLPFGGSTPATGNKPTKNYKSVSFRPTTPETQHLIKSNSSGNTTSGNTAVSVSSASSSSVSGSPWQLAQTESHQSSPWIPQKPAPSDTSHSSPWKPRQPLADDAQGSSWKPKHPVVNGRDTGSKWSAQKPPNLLHTKSEDDKSEQRLESSWKNIVLAPANSQPADSNSTTASSLSVGKAVGMLESQTAKAAAMTPKKLPNITSQLPNQTPSWSANSGTGSLTDRHAGPLTVSSGKQAGPLTVSGDKQAGPLTVSGDKHATFNGKVFVPEDKSMAMTSELTKNRNELNSTVNDIENSLSEEWWDSLFDSNKKSVVAQQQQQQQQQQHKPPAVTPSNGLNSSSKSPATDGSSLSSTAAVLRLSGALQRAPQHDDQTPTNTQHTTHSLPRGIQEQSILREWKAGLHDDNVVLTKGPRTAQYDKLKEESLLRERPRGTAVQGSDADYQHDKHGTNYSRKEGGQADYNQLLDDLDREDGKDDWSNYGDKTSHGDSRSNTAEQRGEAKPVIFEGIGPRDEKTGVPIATRKSIDEAHHKDWYRCMYNSLHRTHKHNPDVQSVKPMYVLTDAEMSSHEEDVLSPGSVNAASDKQALYPPHARYRVHRYKNQPMRIEDYEPGFHSSIAQKAAKTCESERLLENLKTSDDSVESKRRQKRGLSHSASRADGHTFRQHWDEENHRRRQEVERIIEAERHKRFIQEQRAIQARKHNDFEHPLQKTSMLQNRFDEDELLTADNLERPMYKAATRVRGKARAIHNFHAQNSRELTLRKGDRVYLLRQIDANWFKGERHGAVGIFPISYVEVLTSLDEALVNAGLREGKAWARYNVKGQSAKELSVRKGDVVKLIRRIDDNWYEARSGDRQGIIPVAFLDTAKEPDSPRVTPMSSRAQTPIQGRISPASSDISHGPDVPSAPTSPWMSDFYDSEFEGGDSRRSRDRSRDSDRSHDSSLAERRPERHSYTPAALPSPSRTNYPTYRSQGIIDRAPYNWPASEPSTLSRSDKPNTLPRDLFDLARQRRQHRDDPHGLMDWTNSLPNSRSPSSSWNDAGRREKDPWTTPLSCSLPAGRGAGLVASDNAGLGSSVLPEKCRGRRLNSSLPIDKSAGLSSSVPSTTVFGNVSEVGGGKSDEKSSGHSGHSQSASSLLLTTSKTPQSAGKAIKSTGSNKNIQRYKVLFSYEPRHLDELALEEGDVIDVVEKCDDGWFVGTSQRTNDFGTFPGNYVQPIDVH